MADYLPPPPPAIVAPAPPLTIPVPPHTPEPCQTAIIVNLAPWEALNIRSGPSAGFVPTGFVYPPGFLIAVCGGRDGWLFTPYGWVYSAYVQLVP